MSIVQLFAATTDRMKYEYRKRIFSVRNFMYVINIR